MQWRYVIKSKDRTDVLKTKTYSFLKKYGVEDKDIDIFVSTNDNFRDYKLCFPDCKIIRGPLGIANIDNFIVDYYEEKQHYIYLNDDIRDIKFAKDSKTLVSLADTTDNAIATFKNFISMHFYNMKKLNISYGGLYPVMNPYFMRGCKDTFRTDLCLIMDPFSFVINNKKIKLNNFYLDDDFNENMYSDFEKTILHFETNGALYRLNHYSLDVLYFNGKDTSNRTAERAPLAAELMLAAYPEYLQNIKYLKNGFCSLRFKRIKNC